MKLGLRNLSSEKGATMVEYALMIALISIALIPAVSSLRGDTQATFTKASTQMTAATDETTAGGTNPPGANP